MYLEFSEEGVYMGEGLTPGEPCGPHITNWRARGGPALPGGVGAPQPPHHLAARVPPVRQLMVWGPQGSPGVRPSPI